MSGADQLEDPRVEAAIDWMVEMKAGSLSDHQLRTFEAWLQADPQNEAAWIRLQGGLMPFGVAARRGLSENLLGSRRTGRTHSRRTVLTGMVAVLGAGGVAGVANRFVPLDNLLADHFTRTAEQRQVSLADGSELVLAPRTAVNVRYEPGLRCVQLLEGEMLLRTASRATPFQVDIGSRTLRTHAGVFVLENRNAVLSVVGVEGRGELGGFATGGPYTVAAGDLIEVGSGRVQRLTADTSAAIAWTDKVLVAQDRPLAALVDKLRPYFPGVIRVDPTVAALRVTGVFSLTDPNVALDALAESLGISLSRFAGYWVSLGPAGP